MKWLPVVGLEDLYLVSENGVIKRIETGRILKQFPNKKGYMSVVMHKEGKPVSSSVHRIVAKAFIPNPLKFPQVNHIDANKRNNHVGNLEWVTNEMNMKHAKQHGCFNTFSQKQFESVNRNILKAQGWNRKKVVCMNMAGENLFVFDSILEAERKTGCNNSKIVDVCKGRRKHTKGFKFKYLEAVNE